MRPVIAALVLSILAAPALAAPLQCSGIVFLDGNGNLVRDASESGVAGVKVSDGVRLVTTDAHGRYSLPLIAGRSIFVIKPAGYRAASRTNGLPDTWLHLAAEKGPALKYGGIVDGARKCRDFALLPAVRQRVRRELHVVLMTDPQPKSAVDVGYYDRDVVASVLDYQKRTPVDLGLTLGDIVNDDLSLYPLLNRATAGIGAPWLHVPGNHDLDFDASRDEDSLLTWRNTYGPDTFAWEEAQAVFVGLDDVVYRPGASPAYVGGLREEQFQFLEAYLPTVPTDRLLVVGVHIPFFNTSADPKVETFRATDRERLFGLLKAFPHVLLLSGHSHNQRHFDHTAATGWTGVQPLHEYNVGAACGAFWSGVKDAAGIPDATMSDGTPNGFAVLEVGYAGRYRLAWHPARDPDRKMTLHAPRVLRHGAWPGQAVYANVFMGRVDTRVEYRIDDGPWKPMQRVVQPDPALLAENLRDDAADALRAYDRAPEALPSQHLWRGALPTDLTIGEHHVTVRAADLQGRGEDNEATTSYRLVDAQP
ncbi:calcineurin-like phosphoesterase C-terminal domain-containing protein [Lysobacter fragariae]